RGSRRSKPSKRQLGDLQLWERRLAEDGQLGQRFPAGDGVWIDIGQVPRPTGRKLLGTPNDARKQVEQSDFPLLGVAGLELIEMRRRHDLLEDGNQRLVGLSHVTVLKHDARDLQPAARRATSPPNVRVCPNEI